MARENVFTHDSRTYQYSWERGKNEAKYFALSQCTCTNRPFLPIILHNVVQEQASTILTFPKQSAVTAESFIKHGRGGGMKLFSLFLLSTLHPSYCNVLKSHIKEDKEDYTSSCEI